MRIDVHTHIFPEKIVKCREDYFTGEKAFRSLYESPKSRLVTAETLLQAMDEDEVDKAFTFGFPWESLEKTRAHNDYVLEACEKYPRLIPLCCIQPMIRGATEEAIRCLEAGAKGLGELAIYEDCEEEKAIERYRELADICRHYHGVLLIHSNEPVGHRYPGKAPMGLRFYYEIAKVCREIPLILAHWGGGLGFYMLLKKEVDETLKDVYYDTAASPYLYRPERQGRDHPGRVRPSDQPGGP